MIVELTRARVAELEGLTRDLIDQPDLTITLQCLSDQFCKVPLDVLKALDKLFAAFPRVGLRLYSAMDHSAPVHLENLRALPNLQQLKLHYGVPAVADVAPLAALARLQSAELEIRASYPLGPVLAGWPKLKALSLIREGKASKAVDLSGIAELSELRSLYVMGYSKGIEALAHCRALSSLKLQSLSLPAWDILPPQRLDLLRLNAVKAPDPVPFGDLQRRAQKVELVRMDASLPFETKRAVSKVSDKGWFTIDIDYLNGFHDEEWSGHDWAGLLVKHCRPPDGISLDPEAGSLSVAGERGDLAQYQLRLLPAFAAALGK